MEILDGAMAEGALSLSRAGAPMGPAPGATAVAVGNFDGVHRGHRDLLARARAAAERLSSGGAPAAVAALTFDPHPRRFFQPDAEPFALTPPAVKHRRLAACGVARHVSLRFDAALAATDAETFAREALARGLGARHVVVGADFRFGAGRAGDAEGLAALGARLGFTVEAAPLLAGPDGAVFSSSAARAALRAGDPIGAARILGDWHRIEGVVEQGDQRGRELGFPTANLGLDGVLLPAFGVYAVRAEVRDGPHRGVYDGAASLGLRPTFDKTAPNFETYLFDFAGDIYGATLSVSLVAFLRPEWRFDGLEPLIAQMTQDCADARAALARAVAPW